MTENYRYLEPETEVVCDGDSLRINSLQRIDDRWLNNLRRQKAEEATRCGDWTAAMDVPCIFIDRWLNEGFDWFREPIQARMRKLHQEGLEDFIVTRKRL